MRAVARVVGQIFAVLLITLALDYVLLATAFSNLKRNWSDAATAYTHSYISVPWHHDLAPCPPPNPARPPAPRRRRPAVGAHREAGARGARPPRAGGARHAGLRQL